MKIQLAQINPTLGDFKYNAQLMEQSIFQAHKEDVDLLIFPECSLFGYHPFDLLEKHIIVKEQIKYISRLSKKIPKNMGVIIGAITESTKKNGRKYLNAAVFLKAGSSPKVFAKELLPTFDVFDEGRHIEPGDVSKNILKFKKKRILVTICEDIWAWPEKKGGHSRYTKNPFKKLKGEKFDLVVNLSASPFYPGKVKQREHAVKQTSQYFKAPMVYVNMVGAQDEIIFDGGSFAVDKKSKVLIAAKRFTEDFVNLELKKNDLELVLPKSKKVKLSKVELQHKAITLGIRDFVNKTGFKKIHLGLSGGVDSAVVAVVAAQAIGAKNISLFGMPGPYNNPKSLECAKQLCQNIGARWFEMPIKDIYETLVNTFEDALGPQEFGVIHENFQARARAILLMGFANKEKSLLLNTSNKSELAMGYSTLYGDLCGGLSPVGDLLKSEVFELAEWLNKDLEIIPRFIIDRPPSAELRPNQKDSDTLPEYAVLDSSVNRLVTEYKDPKSIVDQRVMNSLLVTEFKRWQAPPILKVSSHAFGRGRRLPIAHRANPFLGQIKN